MLEQQEKIKEVLNKFMEKSIDSVLEGVNPMVELSGVSIIKVLDYVNSKVSEEDKITTYDLDTNEFQVNMFLFWSTRKDYDERRKSKYLVEGCYLNGWIKFALNIPKYRTYDN